MTAVSTDPSVISGPPTPTIRRPAFVRLLVVDDDATQLKLCRLRLRKEGFVLETASSAEEALEKARRWRPNVIMSDVVMGGLDGFGLCRRVREAPELAGVPVILLSAHFRDDEDRALATRVGASALVERTPDFSAELAALEDTLRGEPVSVASPTDAAVYEEQLRATNKHLTAAMTEARRSEQRYRALFDNAADMISVLTPEGMIVEANQRSRELFGVPPEEMIGRHVSDFAPPGSEETHTADYQESVGRGQDRQVVAIHRPDGEVRYVEFSTKVFELDGEPHLLSVGRDVTEKRQLEETLRQAQKIEALGQLTGGIAHDFNNILAVIIANSHLLLEDLGETDPRREDVEQIRQAGDRAASLTRQLLAFSRKQVLEPTALDLNATVGGLEKMLRRIIGEDIELSFARGAALGTVRADAGQLEQVVMNLVVNARDAMRGGGKLDLETSNVELDDAYTASHVGVRPGPYVLLTVSDNGRGMDAETQRRLFEPFFTTKAPGKGTGLGLSTCHGIVHQSGGAINVYSELGHGTVFKVYLPRVDAAPEALPARHRLENLHGTETVLLVEDDDRVRGAVARMLSGYGYNVLRARDGKEAFSLTKRRNTQIDLVISDMVMPGPTGPEVTSEVRRTRPAARALFMSGYTDHAIFRDGGIPAGVAFIQKPFAPEALAKKVRSVLDA